MFKPALLWRLVRAMRHYARPLWQIKVGGVPLWRHMGGLVYRLPWIPNHVRLPWGHTLYFPPGFHGRVEYYLNQYEPALTRCIQTIVRRGMHVIDVGANIGYYTLLMAHLVGEEGGVYAFEPEPSLYQALLRNINANELKKVYTYPYVVSNYSGTTTFYTDPLGVSSSLIPDKSLPQIPISVRSVQLDEFLSKEQTIHFAKIDVEGAELSCLQGMQGIIQRSPDIQVALEMNLTVLEQLGMSPHEYFDRLSELGGRRIWAIEYDEKISSHQSLSYLLEKMRSQNRKVVNLLVGFTRFTH